MRFFTTSVVAVVVFLWLGIANHAGAQPFPPLAGVNKLGPSGSVYFAGRQIWRAKRHGERLITPVRSSRTRDAVAFATRAGNGAVTLVVVLVSRLEHGHVMTWPIPRRAQRRGTASVMWMGRQRVGFGYSPIRPVVVASWRLRR